MKYFLALFLLFSLAINAQHKEVVAVKGDGIYSILLRNKLTPPVKYLDRFVALNKDKLGKNNQVIIGRKYKLPLASEPNIPMDWAILGRSNKIESKSTNLKGAVIYLMSGHGGPDPGAMGKYAGKPVSEDEYAYDVTLRLAKNLLENGATVYMIIQDPNDGIREDQILALDNDEVCYPGLAIPLNHKERLKQRTDAVNNLYNSDKSAYKRLICIHVDSRSTNKNIDVFFYHYFSSIKGKEFATTLKNVMEAKYGKNQPNRGYSGSVSGRNLYTIVHSLPVTAYIELGNINHSRDQQRLVVANNRQALANWLEEGIVIDYNNNNKKKNKIKQNKKI